MIWSVQLFDSPVAVREMPFPISLARAFKGHLPVWAFNAMNAPQANAMSGFDPSHANKVLRMSMGDAGT